MCAEIKPFRPLRFSADRIESLSPPFDTISKDQEVTLKKNPFNITYLTLPGKDGPDGARTKLEQWRKEHILSPEEKDSILVVKQEFSFEGKQMTRFGIISLVRINPDDGTIKPHEKTFESAVNGRVSIMSRLESQLEPIFLAVDSNSFGSILTSLISEAEADFSYVDGEGTRHTVYTITDSSSISILHDALASSTFLVADGHHRLEATRRLSRETSEEKKDFWSYVMAYITPLNEDGLVIAGIHRLVKKDLKLDQFSEGAGKYFELRRRDGYSDTGNMFVYDGNFTELVPRVDEISGEMGIKPGNVLVEAEVLNEILFDRVLKLSKDDLEYKVTYIHDLEDAAKQVDAGDAGMVVVMPKWSKEEFLSVISDGRYLPQKSTYFFPKIPSGIAVNSYPGN